MCGRDTCKLTPLFVLQCSADSTSFGATGTISCVIGYFVLPEIRCRTPAEIDEMFEAKIAPRKFWKHVTQVQIFLDEKQNMEKVPADQQA